MTYYVLEQNNKFFLNLCGQYSLVSDVRDATIWKNINDSSLWFLKNELSNTTGRTWEVREVNNYDIVAVEKIEEPEKARIFYIQLSETLENYEKCVTVEKEFFDPDKYKLLRMWIAKIYIGKVEKQLLIAECYNGKYYRMGYK